MTCAVQLDTSIDILVTVGITWFGPGGMVLNGLYTRISTAEYQSTLMLTSLLKGDAGNYTCSVTVSPNSSSYVIPLTSNMITQGNNVSC